MNVRDIKVGDQFVLGADYESVDDGECPAGTVVEVTRITEDYWKFKFDLVTNTDCSLTNDFFVKQEISDGAVKPLNQLAKKSPSNGFICVDTPMGNSYIKISEIVAVTDEPQSQSWLKCCIHCGVGAGECFNTSETADEVMAKIQAALGENT